MNNPKILTALLYYLTFSGLAIALLYSINTSIDWIFLKDGFVILAAIIAIFIKARSLPRDTIAPAIPITAITAISFLISPAPEFAKIASARQIITPFIFLLIGYSLSKSNSYEHLVKTFLTCIILIVIFGTIERAMGIWSILDIESFFRSKNLPVFGNGYPVVFIEPISLFGYRDFEHGMFRMVSTILDPINLGHILAAAVVIVSFDKNIKISDGRKKIIAAGAFTCLLLTFSKGALLQLFLSSIILKNKNRLTYITISSIIAIPLITSYIQSHSGFLIHLNGFFSIIDHITLFGHGLATFGNYSILYNTDSISSEAGVTDSFWSSILGQLGLLGFAAWISPILYICWKSRKNKPLSTLLLTQSIICSISENSFNFMSIAFLLILIGSYLRNEHAKKVSTT